MIDKRVFDDPASLTEIKDSIRNVIAWPWYQDALKNTNDAGYHFEFLFAVKDFEGRTDILHLHHTDLAPIQENFYCIGSGRTLAMYLSTWLHRPSLPIELWAPLALHVFRDTKKYSDGCGGDTNIYPLFNGFEDTDNRPSVTAYDSEFLWGLYDRLRPLVYGCFNKKVPDHIFESHLHHFTDHIKAIRTHLRDTP